ncbi:uncharacterized protein BDV17DRAFT_277034 [Aspergillus undulatus]|uniref:uncharacterized protein n=1 Tax=Aspergillus undulatus TaxID=1810928 RepID=UPI003CCD1CEE
MLVICSTCTLETVTGVYSASGPCLHHVFRPRPRTTYGVNHSPYTHVSSLLSDLRRYCSAVPESPILQCPAISALVYLDFADLFDLYRTQAIPQRLSLA